MVRAAVRVVLPWSTWPIVPMLTWGFLRSNLPRAARTVRERRRWWRVGVGVGVKKRAGLVVKEVEERISFVRRVGFESGIVVGVVEEEEGGNEGYMSFEEGVDVAAAEIAAMMVGVVVVWGERGRGV